MSEPSSNPSLTPLPGVPTATLLDRGALRVHRAVMDAARERAMMLDEIEREHRRAVPSRSLLAPLLSLLIIVVVGTSVVVWLERGVVRGWAQGSTETAWRPGATAASPNEKPVALSVRAAPAVTTERVSDPTPASHSLRVDVRRSSGTGEPRATVNGQPYALGTALEIDIDEDGLARADIVVHADGHASYQHTVYLARDTVRIIELTVIDVGE